MRIVILDGRAVNPGDIGWDEIAQMGKLCLYDTTRPEDVAERIGDAEAVFTNKSLITREVLTACPRLRFVGVLATGYNVVDVAAAREKGVVVANVPGYSTEAVAQFALALLLEICCHVGLHSEQVHAGRWEKCADFCFWDKPLIELAGKTMGIIGFGRIGQATGMLARALGMRVMAYSRSVRPEGQAIAEYVDGVDALYRASDVIALHCPLTSETRGMINRDSIAKMKDGVIVLNNSRGQLIVEQDLADALASGKVYAAGLDVVSSEPIQGDNPLLSAPNCLITPHISWAPKETRVRLIALAAKNLEAFLRGERLNVVS
ncbi:MAG: D-2-hydroxyacid dehydrogenase [Clostridia bacterium]